jgi:MoaA/NifB/PqqE/SkfB family radical SAM enzyme
MGLNDSKYNELKTGDYSMKSDFNLEEYLSNGVEYIVKGALKASLTNLKEGFFLAKYYFNCKRARRARINHERKGEHIPPFLIGSITNTCNLNCKGCYVKANHTCGEHAEEKLLAVSDWRKIFSEADKLGIRFILLAGGEPLLRRNVINAAADYKRILFPIFTNGTLQDDSYIKLFDKNRNLLPILSVEGEESFTDERRGSGIYTKVLSVMEQMKERGIFFGASITVTRENIQNVTDDSFVSNLYFKGCKVIFYVEYVPVDNNTVNLAPAQKERIYLSRMLSLLRVRFEDMLFLTFPGDEKSSGGCLAAGRGFFHINPFGKAEPCPFSPYSDTDLREKSLLEALRSPLFQKLNASNILIQDHTGGCVLFNQEEEVKRLQHLSEDISTK